MTDPEHADSSNGATNGSGNGSKYGSSKADEEEADGTIRVGILGPDDSATELSDRADRDMRAGPR